MILRVKRLQIDIYLLFFAKVLYNIVYAKHEGQYILALMLKRYAIKI